MAKKKSSKVLKATTHMLSAISALSDEADNQGHFISLPDIILPDTSDPLMLSVVIGTENQTGSFTVAILEPSSFTDTFIKGSTEEPLEILPSNTLNRMSLLIVADITDTNQDTENNVTSITIELSVSGVVVFKDHHETTLKNEGDTSKFTYKISCHV